MGLRGRRYNGRKQAFGCVERSIVLLEPIFYLKMKKILNRYEKYKSYIFISPKHVYKVLGALYLNYGVAKSD